MQKQEISNIMIFFVTQDLEGQPRQLEMHLMPEKEVSMMNQRFTEYLQRQREMYKPSLVQSHLPDLYLCRYQFPAGVSYPDIRLFDKDNSLVQKFITRNGGSMQGNVSLRGLEYLHSHEDFSSQRALSKNRLYLRCLFSITVTCCSGIRNTTTF